MTSTWQITKLGKLAAFKGGSAFPQEEQGGSERHLPFAKVSDLSRSISDRYMDNTREWISSAQAKKLRPVIAPPSATLFAKIGEGLRSERFRQLETSSAFDNNLMSAVSISENCHPDFLYYLLRTLRIAQYAVGSALPYLTQARLSSVPVRVPPLPEQRAIAEVLGALDDKIAVNRRIAHSARILGEALFERNTRHSAQVPLDRLSDPLLGGTPSRAVDNYWNGDVPWVSVRDISAAVEEAILSTEESITQEGSLNSRAKVIPAGSVILSARGTVGSVARLIIPAAFNQSCYAFTPESIPPGLLYYSVRHAAKSAKLVAHGSVFSTITMNTLSSMMVPRVDPAKASALEAHLVALLQSVDAALQESQTLATLRDTLLPALMDGTLRVKDAISQAEGVL